MRHQHLLNTGWYFKEGFSDADIQPASFAECTAVVLPHTVQEVPYNHFSEAVFHKDFSYYRTLTAQELSELSTGRRAILTFEGVMTACQVYLDGKKLAEHRGGYTEFDVDITDALKPESDNLLTVAVDARERPDTPPFGGQLDYQTYGGIYRDVHLSIVEPVSIQRVKVETTNTLAPEKGVNIQCWFRNPTLLTEPVTVTADITTPEGEIIATKVIETAPDAPAEFQFEHLTDLELWSVESPSLYLVTIRTTTPAGTDLYSTRFGFRTAEFRVDGFYLNNKRLTLCGANRHQSWPYLGYAVGPRAQRKDADLMRFTLGFNLVRTSHYPQSKAFIDHCDSIGLLVFEEIPGWQHLGGEDWQEQVCADVKDMIQRDWNSPSIILWGVRINESPDHTELYTRTNRIARSLDRTRQTGGVRCIENSEFLEDVFTMNDFIHSGEEIILRDQETVTGLNHKVPYLVTEYNGHMYPTKRFDQEQRQHEHTLRHLKILDQIYGTETTSGGIAWSLFDYNTHKDFGSGDRICYHGVTDMFRIEKHAAFAYASQKPASDDPVMHPVTAWARGERDISGAMPLMILTNCDYLEFQYGSQPVRRVYPDRDTFPNLPNAPVILDERTLDPSELGEWGLAWSDVKLTGFVNDEAVIQKTLAADSQPTRLSIEADDTTLSSTQKELTRVVIRGLDQNNNQMPYWSPVVQLSISGPGRIVGPSLLTLTGGAIGTYVETTMAAGQIELKVTAGDLVGAINIEVT
ncbi:MAG: glycoside hydrolase family 2 TIM barrel-domain containing protein [Saccharospirillum sp.]|uniref:glycoside hydrolase family 2 protein n=1 Tax=Saccharospirillum sp. TaxID=2033801 RepID=UPI003299849B